MADRMTTDHEEVRRWVEAHGGRLATVQRTGDGEESPDAISWAEWLQKFEENRLAFLDQDEMASGKDGTFLKLVRRDES